MTSQQSLLSVKILFIHGMVRKRIHKISTSLTQNSQISQKSAPIKTHQSSHFIIYQTLLCIIRNFFPLSATVYKEQQQLHNEHYIYSNNFTERIICQFRVELC